MKFLGDFFVVWLKEEFFYQYKILSVKFEQSLGGNKRE
jgi:hypothetical protein